MKHIFVPTDFSDCAKNATEYAISFASSFKSDIILYNGYELPYSETEVLVNVVDVIKDASKRALGEEFERYNPVAKSKQVNLIAKSQFGATPNAICNAAFENKADLIIMGTHGASGLTKVLLGSNAAGVSKESKIPVLIIPNNANAKPIKRIVFAYDMQKKDAESVLNPLIELAKNTNAHITILNMNNDVKNLTMDAAVSGVNLHAGLAGLDHVFVFSDNTDIAEGIKDAAYKYGADLVVVISRHHNVFASLFHKSATKQVAYSVDVPMLVLPE